MRLLLTTNPGIEDIAADEAKARLGARIVEERSGRGRIIVDIDDENLYLIPYLRSIHRARILLARGTTCEKRECLKNIAELILSTPDIASYITPMVSFAVRVERVGTHEYTSIDVARITGDAVIRLVEGRYGARPKVDLDYPAVVLAVDVTDSEVVAGIEISGEFSWHKRGYRVYDHPAALKPTLAYAMIILSGMVDGESLIDPMCGGGTIPIEAAYIFETSRLYCMDHIEKHVLGAMRNALSALVYPRIKFIVGDARRLAQHVGKIDYIISNPPYGIRLGSPREVRKLYREFVKQAAMVVNKKIVLITTERDIVVEEAEASGLRVVHERKVSHGGLRPSIVVLGA